MHPYSAEVIDRARIVKRIVVFDELERVLDAAQARLGLAFPAPDPKSINRSAR